MRTSLEEREQDLALVRYVRDRSRRRQRQRRHHLYIDIASCQHSFVRSLPEGWLVFRTSPFLMTQESSSKLDRCFSSFLFVADYWCDKLLGKMTNVVSLSLSFLLMTKETDIKREQVECTAAEKIYRNASFAMLSEGRKYAVDLTSTFFPFVSCRRRVGRGLHLIWIHRVERCALFFFFFSFFTLAKHEHAEYSNWLFVRVRFLTLFTLLFIRVEV